MASPWPAEDGGPRRLQVPHGVDTFGARATGALAVTHADAPGTTMAVVGDGGELYVLRHTFGDDVVIWVERRHPDTLEVERRSPDLPAGPFWPGGLALAPGGDPHVVCGRWAHRLDGRDLTVRAAAELPRPRPYNSFVTLADGRLATKDFGGTLPMGRGAATDGRPGQVVLLDPETLTTTDAVDLPEPSVARLSADGDAVYAVGTEHLLRVEGGRVEPVARYRTLDGQGHGWDAVLALGAAWFLDDGEGTERFDGALSGLGLATSPLHLVRVGLDDGEVRLAEVCGRPGGIVANPPAVDGRRRIAVGYDSGNGVVTAFDADTLEPRWRREQHHGCHPLLFPGSGELLTADHDRERMREEVVVLDIETGDELARAASGSPLQSVLFPAAGAGGVAYLCSFSTITRIAA